MAAKLSDRLRDASRRLFVGRQTQRKLLANALLAEDLPFSVLHIYGPGGIGKTSLLYEFRRDCEEAKVPVVYLDARSFEADPIAFVREMKRGMALDEGEKPEDVLGAKGRHVLMLDTFELLFALEQWLYSEFFPELNESVLIVIAGRYPPSSNWTDNPGWRSLIKTSPLRNLSPDESRLYLSRTGMPDKYHQAAIDYTHGHPLALSLVADSFGGDTDASFDGELEPNFIKVLLDRFVREAPSLDHRLALEACVLVNHLTEPLLALMVDQSDARELFEWLRSLSFVEAGNRGLFPHDIAREVLGSELKWRNPDLYKQIHQNARAYYKEQLQQATQEEQGNILKDYIFLHRDNAIVRPFFVQLQSTWQGGAAAVSIDRYRNTDLSQIESIVEKHEGADAGKIARMWIQQQPENLIVFRNPEGEVAGFLFLLALHKATTENLEADAVALACKTFIDKAAPLRSGEAATVFRFWMDAEAYQHISQIQSLIFVYMVRHYLTTPSLAYSMVPISNPEFWKPVFEYADLVHLEGLDYTIEEKSFGVFGHDWRSRPPTAWLDVLGSRETGGSMQTLTTDVIDRPVLVLSEETFADAVRQVLRNFTRLDKLTKSPLLFSRLVADKVPKSADITARIEKLMEIVNECVALLENNTKQLKAFKALDRTYIRPTASQEQAAEILNMPYSTFRRHLSVAVTEITGMLWQREIGV